MCVRGQNRKSFFEFHKSRERRVIIARARERERRRGERPLYDDFHPGVASRALVFTTGSRLNAVFKGPARERESSVTKRTKSLALLFFFSSSESSISTNEKLGGGISEKNERNKQQEKRKRNPTK